MQIEELIKRSFVQKGKRIDHRKLAEAIKLSVRTTTRFTDDEIDRCRKFLKDTENYGYLEIIKDDFRDSRLSFKNINERYNSGELSLNEARNSLLPIFIMNSILTHFELEFIDFDEILVIYMEAIKEDYFDIIKPYVDRLFDICGDEIVSIIENQLGEGKRVTDATDDDLVALDSIYNNLVTKATMLGIDV